MPIRKARQLPTWRTALLALLFATSLLPISGSAEARDSVLRIGWDSKAPYAYLEHKGQTEYLTGMDVELVRMIGDDAGFKPDFEEGGLGKQPGGYPQRGKRCGPGCFLR